MTDNNTALDLLVDEAAIRNTMARFGVAATTNDVAAFRSLWAEDAQWSIGQPYEQKADGVDNIVTMFANLWNGNDYFFQATIPGAVDIDGDTATVRSVCQEFAMGPDDRYYRTTGVWTDQLRRTDSGWVFSSRAWTYLWVDFSPFAGETFSINA